MYLKRGVSIAGLQPEMVTALLMVVTAVGSDIVVTSGTEDAPGRVKDSLHPKGYALDIRVPEDDHLNPFSTRAAWRSMVSQAFDDTEFDLVWYETHVHIEFDPK